MGEEMELKLQNTKSKMPSGRMDGDSSARKSLKIQECVMTVP